MSDAAQLHLRFRPAQRVRRSADFRTVREAGRRFDGGWFLLWARQRSDRGPARLGVAASRFVGDAVQRNRCKRLLREMFRHHQHAIPPGIDLVVSARPAMRGVPWSVLEPRFLKLIRKLAVEPSM